MMDILILLLPLSLLIAGTFLVMFVRAVRTGQFDDLDDAAMRILEDDSEPLDRHRGTTRATRR